MNQVMNQVQVVSQVQVAVPVTSMPVTSMPVTSMGQLPPYYSAAGAVGAPAVLDVPLSAPRAVESPHQLMMRQRAVVEYNQMQQRVRLVNPHFPHHQNRMTPDESSPHLIITQPHHHPTSSSPNLIIAQPHHHPT